MHKTAAEQTQRCQNHFKREYQNVGKAFDQLGRALEQDGNYCKFDMQPYIFQSYSTIFDNRLKVFFLLQFPQLPYAKCFNAYLKFYIL